MPTVDLESGSAKGVAPFDLGSLWLAFKEISKGGTSRRLRWYERHAGRSLPFQLLLIRPNWFKNPALSTY